MAANLGGNGVFDHFYELLTTHCPTVELGNLFGTAKQVLSWSD
jgi:hypothetical protein